MLIEQLEDRRMLAVSIQSHYPYQGFFIVHGTTDHDNIEISIDGAEGMNSITVSDETGPAGTINDAIALSVMLYGGDDYLIITRVGYDQNNMNVQPLVSGGDGNDWIEGTDISAWGEDGDDYLVDVDGYSVNMVGGNGNDTLTLEGNVYQAWIDGGDGNDFINTMGATTYVVIHAGAGDDEIMLSTGQYRDEVNGGLGMDSIWNAQQAGYDNYYSIEIFHGWPI